MRVYIESNFILELVLSQEEVASALEILELSKKGEINLFIPAFSLGEPFWAVAKRNKERKETINLLMREQRSIRRSTDLENLAERIGQIIAQISYMEEKEQKLLKKFAGEIIEIAHVLELNDEVMKKALIFMNNLDLGMQDLIVFSTIHEHLEGYAEKGTNVFISRDKRDFGTPIITNTLKKLNCTYISNFKDGLGFIQGSA